MPNVLLIDDHAVVRKGLKAILEEEFDETVVVEADTGKDGLRILRESVPDAVVLDINLPDINGLEVLKRIRSRWPGLPVLVLSIYGEDQYGERMIRAGGTGYLSKSSAPEYLVAAMKKMFSGQKYISPELEVRLARDPGNFPGDSSVESLSDREYQVFRMLVAGKTVTEIAEELYLSVKTISTHRHHILAKLNMRNNADLVSFALARGLVDQP